jgi:hypothetical protein
MVITGMTEAQTPLTPKPGMGVTCAASPTTSTT